MILLSFLGNDVMGDEGIGYHLYMSLKDELPEWVRPVFLHTDVLRLPSIYNGEDTSVFVDAVVGKHFPCGKIFRMSINKAHNLDASMKHAHMIGLIDSIRLMEKTLPSFKDTRKILYLVGVDPDHIKPDVSLSPCLEEHFDSIKKDLLMFLHYIHREC